VDRFAGLEACRGIGAIVIICYQCYQYAVHTGSPLYVGTPLGAILANVNGIMALVFVLSGFSNFLPFAHAALKQRGRYPIQGFLILRAVRITPVYYVVLLLVWTTSYHQQASQWLDLLEHFTLTQTFDSKHIFWTIGPAWLLSVEFWFYLLLACLGPISYRLCSQFCSARYRAMTLYAICVVLIVVGATYKLWVSYIAHVSPSNYALYFSLPARLDNFGLGMLLAVVIAAYRNRLLVRSYVPWLLRGSALVLIAATYYYRENYAADSSQYIFYQTMWEVAMLLVLTSLVIRPHNLLRQRFLLKPMWRYLGLISYSIFLWYEPLLTWIGPSLPFTSGLLFPLGTLVLIIMVLYVSLASYWLIEYPVSFLRHLFTRNGRLFPRYVEL
jgi:peptidoglycan/LPS O-acetylase OafA/YrhL